MKTRRLVLVVSAFLLASCTAAPSPTSPVDVMPSATAIAESSATISPTPETTSTPTKSPTITRTPAILPTITPSLTPNATGLALATLRAFGDPCLPDARHDGYGSGISPNGEWYAFACYAGPVSVGQDSFLHVLSVDGQKVWRIYFRDFANGGGYDAKDTISAYRWSPEDKYLYAIAWSRLSGCCWIGDRILLVRLDLETGAQVAFLNGMGETNRNPLNFAISEDGWYLFHSPQYRTLDVTNLLTGNSQRVELQFDRSIDANFVLISPTGTQIVLGLFDFPDDAYRYILDSIAFVDLDSGDQTVILADMVGTGLLYLVRWEDDDHILLTTYPEHPWIADFYLLNIHTGELTPTTAP